MSNSNYFQQAVAREMATCRHYVGAFTSDACKAGVNYKELSGEEPGYIARLPCSQKMKHIDATTLVHCDLRSPFTREEADAIVKEREEHTKKFMVAVNAAHADAKAKGFKEKSNGGFVGGASDLKCPNCETGTIRYSVARYNGHMHAGCTTKDCVSWME